MKRDDMFTITYEKLLSFLLLIVSGVCVTLYVENAKLEKSVLLEDTSKLVEASEELWNEIHTYERFLEQLDGVRSKQRLALLLKDIDYEDFTKEVSNLESLKEEKRESFLSSLSEREHVVGKNIVYHMIGYWGLLDHIDNARKRLHKDSSEAEIKLSEDFIELAKSRLDLMRLSRIDMRRYALNLL